MCHRGFAADNHNYLIHQLLGIDMLRRENGFTLAELFISLSVIAIITSIAIPGWKNLATSTRGYTAASSLRHALKFARSEAITRNQIVRMCASTDGETCNAVQDWENGWITYVDTAGESVRTARDPIIYLQPALNGLVIKKNGGEKTVIFNRNGWIGLNRSFSVCSKDLKPMYRITFVHSGRVRTDTKNIQCS